MGHPGTLSITLKEGGLSSAPSTRWWQEDMRRALPHDRAVGSRQVWRELGPEDRDVPLGLVTHEALEEQAQLSACALSHQEERQVGLACS